MPKMGDHAVVLGTHAHQLVPRGTQILDQLLPGLVQDVS
jgi:hypothetical protein